MKALILNRRDIGNPAGGGAEIYTHEVAKALLEAGLEVDNISADFKGAEEETRIDGIRYLRRGNELTVHLHGFLFALRNRRSYDLIIDEFNGLGFFTFLLPESTLLIHQLYGNFWFRELGPAGLLPYLIEPLLLWLYRKRRTITVSPSTAQDLERLGFKKVKIVMNALSNQPLDAPPEKEEHPTLVFLGRLRSTKKPEDAIEIFSRVSTEYPNARLWMIGRGPDEEKLKKMVREKKLDGVSFLGWLDSEEKFDRLRRAHLLLAPGVREGFGINVIEAASMGTPTVGYNIHGLRDSIRKGETGYLARGPADASIKVADLLSDKKQYARFVENCLSYARSFDWRIRASEFRRALDIEEKE